MILALLFLSGGLLLLWKGADVLIRGAVALAERMGVSQLVVGLTTVAIGTSSPEVASSITAALGGKGDIAIGNVYGSNVANLALVGGLVAVIRPLQVQASTLRQEVPAMLGVALLLWPVLQDFRISNVDGVILSLLFVMLLVYTIHTARAGTSHDPLEQPPAPGNPARTTILRDILLLTLGLAVLGVGARLTVSGAVAIGTRIGLSDAVIGSTIMAIGTSLPELVTCVLAAVKGHHGISVGNLIGSNIFNTLAVTGIAGTICPFVVSPRFAGGTDYWIMIAVSACFALAALAGRRTVGRASGAALLALYAGYLLYLLGSPGGP